MKEVDVSGCTQVRFSKTTNFLTNIRQKDKSDFLCPIVHMRHTYYMYDVKTQMQASGM